MANKLIKLVGGVILSVSAIGLFGCGTCKSRQLTGAEKPCKKQYTMSQEELKEILSKQVPEHMKYTFMDPFPFAHRQQ